MSRPIKFRYWDQNDNLMVEWSELLSFITTNNGTFGIQDKLDNAMQFTGLQDKNGTDIYEGDIVKENHAAGATTWEVYYGTQEFSDDNYQAFCMGWNVDPNMLKRIEVIGNIHEHPHLLEEAKE